MNALTKVDLSTAELVHEDLALLEQGPVAPPAVAKVARDPNLTPGVEIIKATVVYGSCRYYLKAQNEDGSHASRQDMNRNIENAWNAGGYAKDGEDQTTRYFYARHNGKVGPSSSNFELIKTADKQAW